MATTTNYGWDTPDDTDLVKDGAAAIRTLGSSVDTTTKALNPETTLGDIAYRSATSNTNTRLAIGSAGQVLTVAAGVPSWASPSDQTPLTTKGDVFTFSTVDARLGVGANGTVLTADSAETTGLKWAAPAAGGMTLINTSGTTLTGASVSISSIPTSYINLVILIAGAQPATDGASVQYRYNGDGATRYKRGYDNADDQTFNSGDLLAGDGQTNNANYSNYWITIPNYANTAAWKLSSSEAVYGSSSYPSRATFRRYWGAYNQTTAITSIDFFPSSGNWTAGTVYVYGVK
jgi:hypothetical protein